MDRSSRQCYDNPAFRDAVAVDGAKPVTDTLMAFVTPYILYAHTSDLCRSLSSRDTPFCRVLKGSVSEAAALSTQRNDKNRKST